MARPGPAPVPTSERIRLGETRPSRLNFDEPLPIGQPDRPEDMDEGAARVWDRVVADAPTGLLTALDADLIRLYCEAISRYAIANQIYRASPLVKRGWYISQDDDPLSPTFGQDVRHPIYVKNPMHQVVRDNAEQIRFLARELGFSPSARVNLHVGLASGHALPFEGDLGASARVRFLRSVNDDD